MFDVVLQMINTTGGSEQHWFPLTWQVYRNQDHGASFLRILIKYLQRRSSASNHLGLLYIAPWLQLGFVSSALGISELFVSFRMIDLGWSHFLSFESHVFILSIVFHIPTLGV